MATRPLKTFRLPPSRLFPDGWAGTARDLRAIQSGLADQVVLRDGVRHPRWIAGVDVGLGRFGRMARAAAVLLDARDLRVVAESVIDQAVALPYLPGLLSFRELPSLLEALAGLPRRPDLIVCDGHGIAHPRRFGIASHLGVVTGIPTIGVAKSILVGVHDGLSDTQGAQTPLRIDGDTVGVMLRSRRRCSPLIVSPGHRMSLAGSIEAVLATLTRFRLPEPTRLADRLSKVAKPVPAPDAG